jgi:hypothetical protein
MNQGNLRGSPEKRTPGVREAQKKPGFTRVFRLPRARPGENLIKKKRGVMGAIIF